MRERRGLSIHHACALLGFTKQAYYKSHWRTTERALHEKRIYRSVLSLREEDPMLGGYKLWLMMKKAFGPERVPGRDRFYKLLSRCELTLPRPKPRHTTCSNHRFHKYPNIAKWIEPIGPNALWVSDITYIDVEDDCCYLHLVTDAYSHKIVGWCLSDSLQARYSVEALMQAIGQAGGSLSGLVHHSDRGIQYCSNAYVFELESRGAAISMTEDSNPTDNAVAERVNGIIKQELVYPSRRFRDIHEARDCIGRFIRFYNDKRPHMSIGMHTPSEAHTLHGPLQNKWKRTPLNDDAF